MGSRAREEHATRLRASDVDYYWFAPDAGGTATIADRGPLRATLTAPNGRKRPPSTAAGTATLTPPPDGRYPDRAKERFATEAVYREPHRARQPARRTARR
jgi:hypothetical protein